MGKQRGKIGKYSKISLQKKFELLKLTQSGKNSLKESSQQLQINYSTAKTIFFQFQNKKIRQKLTFFENNVDCHQSISKIKLISKVATYKTNSQYERKCNQIKIVCTQNRNQTNGYDQMVIEQQKIGKQPIILEIIDIKCKTVNQNTQTLSEDPKNLKDSQGEGSDLNFDKSTNNLLRDEQFSPLVWNNLIPGYSVMNFNQLAYFNQAMGYTIPFQSC